jgi:bloom syndrome protein
VVAGTGAGKTIPFMMPLLLHPEKFVLIISPLKILQEDQVSCIYLYINASQLRQAKRFKQMGLKAAAVNGDLHKVRHSATRLAFFH